MAETDATDETITLDIDGRDVHVALPADASASEAAAIATAVGAHMHDQAVAAEESVDDEPEYVDQWKLAGRMKARGKRHWPQDVRRGEEWKAAARSFF